MVMLRLAWRISDCTVFTSASFSAGRAYDREVLALLGIDPDTHESSSIAAKGYERRSELFTALAGDRAFCQHVSLRDLRCLQNGAGGT